MLTLCIQFGVVPDNFRRGVLIPIPKKAGCDTTQAKNWRPITVSSTFSKLLELYVLEECCNHDFSDLQFGFIKGRGTEMATALLHDVIDYSTTRGSVVYSCSPDAEGAFDAIPHCILFDKAHSVLPTYCRFVMYEWYSQLTINIKWRGCYSKDVAVNIGTRQGGLSSPLLFNIFYQDLIDRLSTQHCGISINKESFNVFCYADDLILTSLTVTGLQSLIDISLDYITAHGLNFNPSKTTCTTFGTTHQEVKPTWNFNEVNLKQDDAVTYLGTRLSNQTRDHIDSRITAARRAFYGLQGAGLCAGGVNPFTIAHIYKTAIQPILTYSCPTLNSKHTDINELEKAQASYIKTALGLPKYSRNTPILRALHIKKISEILEERHLSLTRAALHNTGKSRPFYLHIVNKCQYYHMNKHSNLLQRAKLICNSNGVMLHKYLFNESFARKCKLQFKCNVTDGIADSIYTLFCTYDVHNSQYLTRLLLKPF